MPNPSKATRGTAQGPARDFNKLRATFMQRVSGPRIPPLAFKLAYLIAFQYMNLQTRTAFVAQETLAAHVPASVRTVQRLLRVLVGLGLRIDAGNGRGYASTYSITPVEDERATPVSPFSAQKGDKKGRHQTSKKGDTGVAPTLLKRTNVPSGELNALQKEGESDRASRDESSPPAGTPPLTRDPAEDFPRGELSADFFLDGETESAEAKNRTPAEKNESGASAENAAAVVALDERERAWHALREVWRRGWASDDTAKAVAIAKIAFAKACACADPDEILTAAKAHVAAADAPRFLPPLSAWLAARGWEQPPPQKRSRRRGQQRGYGGGQRKPSLAAAAFRLAQQYEAAERERERERAVS
jgi:hypothetical protein